MHKLCAKSILLVRIQESASLHNAQPTEHVKVTEHKQFTLHESTTSKLVWQKKTDKIKYDNINM